MTSDVSTPAAFVGELVAPGLQVPPVGRRLGARALDCLVGLIGILVLTLILTLVTVPFLALFGAYLTWGVIALGVQLATSATPGQLIVGLRNVVVATGEPSGGRTFAKYLLMGLASSLSCGVLLVIALLTLDQPLRRSWFDKAAGLVVVRRTPVQPRSAPAVGARSSLGTADARDPWESETVGPPVEQHPVLPQPLAAPPPAAPPLTRLRLRLDNGQELSLDRSFVVGRNPVAPDATPDAMPIAVPDEARSISKTHLLVESDGDRVSVHDLHSTNGVTVTQPGEGPVRLAPGGTTRVVAGSTIRFGDRTAEVLQ